MSVGSLYVDREASDRHKRGRIPDLGPAGRFEAKDVPQSGPQFPPQKCRSKEMRLPAQSPICYPLPAPCTRASSKMGIVKVASLGSCRPHTQNLFNVAHEMEEQFFISFHQIALQ